MNIGKILAWTLAGLGLAAAVGGAYWWYRKRKAKQGPEPSKPPRDTDDDEPPKRADVKPRFRYLDGGDMSDELRAEIDKMFGEDGWPPDEDTVDQLEHDDVIMFAVESEPVGAFEHTRQEIINANVLSVEDEVVRGRVITPVKHAEHHGSHAGHGVRVGDSVEVPRDKVLVAARRDATPEGYGSRGKAAKTFKPTSITKEVYKIKPGTPYDLELPHPYVHNPDLHFYVDPSANVFLKVLGGKGPLEQVMFGEATVRGVVKVSVLDHDPKHGNVFVGSWTFEIAD